MARRRSNTMGRRLAAGASQSLGRLLADWAALTWRSDTTKIGPLSITALNWITLALLVIALYFLPAHRDTVLIIAGVWFLITLGRSAAVMPARRNQLQLIYDQNQRTAGLPRGTPSAPISPGSRIQVRSWAGKTPTDLTLTLGDCPAATSVYAHPTVEKSLESTLGDPPEGQAWLFEWPKHTKVRCRLVDADSEDISRQTYHHKVRATTAKMLRVRIRDAADYHFQCADWEGAETKAGTIMQTPGTITIELGDFDYTDSLVRDRAERGLDQRLKCPGEWLYSWGDGDLTMHQVERKSTEARRKRTTRKISDDVVGLLRSGRQEDPPQITVQEWFEHEKVAPDFPKVIEIDFGTRNLADRRVRDKFEGDFDTAMEATYKQVTWLYDWTPSGANTTLMAKAISRKSTKALRKYAERRLRNVVESKFGSSRNFVDCDILEWQKDLAESGEALPQTARVNFGDYDVTKRETQEGFEQHWDSLTTACDWHYGWSPAEGTVVMEAVPPLPSLYFFPEPGSEEFEDLNQRARKGEFVFGPRKGGGQLLWKMKDTPHGLFGGKTGSGKSVALNIPLFWGLYNPDLIEVYVCDPKRTDFTWTPEFPSVTRFAATDAEIVATVGAAKQEMDRRQSLLGKIGVRNIGQLRAKLRDNPELVKTYGPAPKRLIILFDEIADFMAKSADKDLEELKDEARADLEKIGRLGRAMEVNIIAAAQKPDAKIISTQLRSQLGFRLGVGPLDQYESEQILNSDHGTRFPESGTPKGRAWGYDPKGGYQMTQVMFLADETGPLDWMPDKHLTGIKDMIRNHLQDIGYARTQIINQDGGTEDRWVPVEGMYSETQSFDDPPVVDGDVIDEETTEAPTSELDTTTESPAHQQPAAEPQPSAPAKGAPEPTSTPPTPEAPRPHLAVVPAAPRDDVPEGDESEEDLPFG